MKLDRLQELVTTFAITMSGILVAIFLGQWAGRGDKTHIIMLLGSLAGLLLFFKMRQRIWLLIPLLMPLSGKLGFLPLPFSAKQLAILIVFGAYITLIALKVVQTKPRYDLLDLVLLVNLLYSATVYARNPVGTLAIGSERIGGKPYVDLIVGILGYWTLSRVVATSAQLTKIPFFMLISTGFVTGLSFISTHFPFTTPILSQIYSGVDTSTYLEEQVQEEAGIDTGPGEMVRDQYYAPFANTLSTMLCSYYNPSTLLNPFYLFRFVAFMLSIGTMLLSGHRSGLVGISAFFFMSSLLREKFGGFCRVASLVVILFVILILGNGTYFELPKSAQRTLSFLPGKWDYYAKSDAEGSTKWRKEMWNRAMGNSMFESTKYIKSKLLGDGPGFDKAEYANFNLKGGGNEGQQEDLMIAGGFHSGPVSTVRNVGYVGGILFYILMFYTAFRAYKLIARTRSTPFVPMALFIGMPMMWSPFTFTFIFGAFETAFPDTMLYIGFIKMIDQSLTASNVIQKHSTSEPKAELRTSGSRPLPAFVGRPLGGGVQTVET